jgi:hypothetical protein
MTSQQFTTALTRLGITQMGLAKIIRRNERTVRDWVGGRSPVPTEIELLIGLMQRSKANAKFVKDHAS